MSSSKMDHVFQQVELEDMNFGNEDIGLSHPDIPGFVRIRASGVIEIVADEGVAIVLDPTSRGISFIADHVNFFTREEGGLRWNEYEFNDKAVRFDEPAIIKSPNDDGAFELYHGTENYLDHDPPLGKPLVEPFEAIRDARARTEKEEDY